MVFKGKKEEGIAVLTRGKKPVLRFAQRHLKIEREGENRKGGKAHRKSPESIDRKEYREDETSV